MTAGRPTKYNDEILEKTLAYMDDYKKIHDDEIPSIAGLACVLDFSNMLKKLLAKQERILISKGLSGKFNPNITKLVLTKHNYSDKIDQQVEGNPNKPLKWIVEVVKKGDDDGT